MIWITNTISVLFSIVGALAILSFLVIIHEAGHFFGALWAGVKVEEFGLGYPPRAKKLFSKWGTLFSLNWIPVGGFVKMEGEDIAFASDKEVSEDAFYAKTVWQRLVIILAGPVVNLVFGLFIFSIVFFSIGIPTAIDSARVGYVSPDSPAANAGLQIGSNVISAQVDEEVFGISKNQDLIDLAVKYEGQTIKLTTTGVCKGFDCDTSVQDFEIYIRKADEINSQEGRIGIIFAEETLVKYEWYKMPYLSVQAGVHQAWRLSVLTVVALSEMMKSLIMSGSVPQDLSGPVGIVVQTHQQQILKQGILPVLHFMGLLSMSLAIINILPIPALDGGRVVFTLFELFLDRSKLSKVESYVHYGGYIFLLGLVVLVTIKDVISIFI